MALKVSLLFLGITKELIKEFVALLVMQERELLSSCINWSLIFGINARRRNLLFQTPCLPDRRLCKVT